MTDKREDGFLCRMYEIGKNNGKAEKVREATDLLMDFLKKTLTILQPMILKKVLFWALSEQ